MVLLTAQAVQPSAGPPVLDTGVLQPYSLHPAVHVLADSQTVPDSAPWRRLGQGGEEQGWEAQQVQQQAQQEGQVSSAVLDTSAQYNSTGSACSAP